MYQQPTVAQFWTRAGRTSDLCINMKIANRKKAIISKNKSDFKSLFNNTFPLSSHHSPHATVQLRGFVNICIPQVNGTGLFRNYSQDITIFIPVKRYTIPARTKHESMSNYRKRMSVLQYYCSLVIKNYIYISKLQSQIEQT